MALGDVLRVQVYTYTSSQIAINTTYWLSVNSTGAGAKPADAAVVFDNLFAPLYKLWLSAAARYRGVSVQSQAVPRPVPSTSIINDGVGLGTANISPTQVSGLISWYTTLAGRHNRGRIYVGFPDAVFQTADGGLTAGGLTRLTNIAASYGSTPTVTSTAPAGTDTFALVVRAATGTPPIISYTAVVNGVPRNRFATQRRRGQFGRTNTLPF